jgi:hypothetical protein
MNDHGQPGHGWTVVLRRQPLRIVDGEPEGGYTDMYELICCDCGDDPWVDYREVPTRIRQTRGPYLFTAGIAAYARHVRRYHSRSQARGHGTLRRA